MFFFVNIFLEWMVFPMFLLFTLIWLDWDTEGFMWPPGPEVGTRVETETTPGKRLWICLKKKATEILTFREPGTFMWFSCGSDKAFGKFYRLLILSQETMNYFEAPCDRLKGHQWWRDGFLEPFVDSTCSKRENEIYI